MRAIIKIEKSNVTVLDEIRKKGLEIRPSGPRWFTIEGDSELVESVEDMDGIEQFTLDQVFCSRHN